MKTFEEETNELEEKYEHKITGIQSRLIQVFNQQLEKSIKDLFIKDLFTDLLQAYKEIQTTMIDFKKEHPNSRALSITLNKRYEIFEKYERVLNDMIFQLIYFLYPDKQYQSEIDHVYQLNNQVYPESYNNFNKLLDALKASEIEYLTIQNF